MLKKYIQIWKKVKKLLKIKFDSEPVYGDIDKYTKTKIKIYSGNVNTNFQGRNMSKEKVPGKSLSITILDSVVKAKEKYYPQTLLEEYKYEPKMMKMENCIDDDLEKSSSDEPDNEADNDSTDETKSDDDDDDDDESNE